MTTLTGRTRTALVIVDVQNGVMEGVHRRDEVIANINALIDRAREAGAPVVWVQHAEEGLERGSADWGYVPELVARMDESVVHKRYGDAFENTELESVLDRRDIGHVVVVGAETDACIRSTLHGAFVRGYDVTLVADAHTAGDKTAWGAPPVPEVVAHTNLTWGSQKAPGRTAAVVPTEDVRF